MKSGIFAGAIAGTVMDFSTVIIGFISVYQIGIMDPVYGIESWGLSLTM